MFCFHRKTTRKSTEYKKGEYRIREKNVFEDEHVYRGHNYRFKTWQAKRSKEDHDPLGRPSSLDCPLYHIPGTLRE